jgi:hypothetical protein
MKIKLDTESILWMVPGAIAMLLLILVFAYFQEKSSPTEQLAFKARRVDLVSRMQLSLSSASEAEKSAVMAITDQESKVFADQVRAATADVEREIQELEGLSRTSGTRGEKDLLVQFSQTFAEFRRIDDDLLALAVKNTNLKAYALVFGPAARAVQEMTDALSRLASASARSPEATRVMQLSFGAQTSALRIQTLLAPHIAEETDAKMAELEASMAREDKQVRQDLDGLKALPASSRDPLLAQAASSYARFGELRTEILALSHENTNVRSLAISLNQKRRVTLLCQDTLGALKQAILDEPVRGVTYGRPPSPR